jgi:hypothetical protein
MGQIPPPDSSGEEDLIDDEEDGSTASTSDTGHPGQLPIPLLELNMKMVNDETREEIENLEDQWTSY